MKNIFTKPVAEEVVSRINALDVATQPNWGKMSVDQMLAHCNVTYEFVYDDIHPKPKGFKKWMLKTFIKNAVVSEKPYKKNGRTAPEFLMTSEKDFKIEKMLTVFSSLNATKSYYALDKAKLFQKASSLLSFLFT